MWETVEAEVDIGGNVRLLEKIEICKTRRALLIVLEEVESVENESVTPTGNTAAFLELLNDPNFVNRTSYPVAEIEDITG